VFKFRSQRLYNLSRSLKLVKEVNHVRYEMKEREIESLTDILRDAFKYIA